MPKPRCSGLSRSMRVESSQMLPFDNVSRPARQLSAVDLPQPDGPSKAMNSPRRTVSVTPLSALTLPKLRLIPSSLSSRKSRAAIAMMNWLLFLLRTDLLVPAGEGIDELVGQQRQFLLVVRDRRGILVAAEFLDNVLALFRRHRDRHVLHGWARIEVAGVIGGGLRLFRQHVVDEIDQHCELLVRHALGDAEVVCFEDSVEALEEEHLGLLGHHAEGARIDVPAHLL